MNALDHLCANPVLRNANRSALVQLARNSTVRIYEKNAPVVRQGTLQSHVFMVSSGSIAVWLQHPVTGVELLLSVVERSGLFGDIELMAQQPTWSMTARSAVSSTLIIMPNRDFKQLVLADASVAAGLYRDASARWTMAVHLIQLLRLEGTDEKILRLVRAANRGKTPAAISQLEIARTLGVSRKTIERRLHDLERRGVIRRTGRRITPLAEPAEQDEMPTYGFGYAWRLPSRAL